MNSRTKTFQRRIATLDRQYVWHPFTQMKDWMKSDPTVIVSGRGAFVKDARGKRYLDANASIWTNLHGHGHPRLNRALRAQLNRISHCSALGLANEPASLLAEKLVRKAPRGLQKVFYSDDGSTAIETALKMAYQSRAMRKPKGRQNFLALGGAYHGDTVGAMSVGGIGLFQNTYHGLLFNKQTVMSPHCYHCPFNRAKPGRGDARLERKCHWECLGLVEKALRKYGKNWTAAVIEPVIQGAAGMIVQPEGYLKQFATLCHQHGAMLVADEIMTGFGRTGKMFACEHEMVSPDFLCLAKGLTGGYLPLAATLTTKRVFNSFLGDYAEQKTFFHGHSFTANPLACSAALANLGIFEEEQTLNHITLLQKRLSSRLASFWELSHVGDIRQAGFIAGIELVRDWKTRKPFPWQERVGIRVCDEAKKEGVLTRPIGNVLVIMPPYCTTPSQLDRICGVLHRSIQKVLSS